MNRHSSLDRGTLNDSSHRRATATQLASPAKKNGQRPQSSSSSNASILNALPPPIYITRNDARDSSPERGALHGLPQTQTFLTSGRFSSTFGNRASPAMGRPQTVGEMTARENFALGSAARSPSGTRNDTEQQQEDRTPEVLFPAKPHPPSQPRVAQRSSSNKERAQQAQAQGHSARVLPQQRGGGGAAVVWEERPSSAVRALAELRNQIEGMSLQVREAMWLNDASHDQQHPTTSQHHHARAAQAAAAVSSGTGTPQHHGSPHQHQHHHHPHQVPLGPPVVPSFESKPIFTNGCLSEKMASGVPGKGMHRMVREKLSERRDTHLSNYESDPRHFFSELSFLEMLQEAAARSAQNSKDGMPCGDAMASLGIQRKKYVQSTAPVELASSIRVVTPRDPKDVLRRKIAQDQHRMAMFALEVEKKYGLATSSGANKGYCARVFITWIRLLQVSRAFASAIADKWAFNDQRRDRALFHPPQNNTRIVELTMAANLICRNMLCFRMRKRMDKKRSALERIYDWVYVVHKVARLKFAATKFQRKVRKIQRCFRQSRECWLARRALWARQWLREESRALRLCELSKDEELVQALSALKAKSTKDSRGQVIAAALSSITGGVGKDQKRSVQLLKQKLREYSELTKQNAVLVEDFFPQFQLCQCLQPTPYEVVFERVSEVFDAMEKAFFDRDGAGGAYKQYCHEKRDWKRRDMWTTGGKGGMADPPPELPAFPRYLREYDIFALILKQQKRNKRSAAPPATLLDRAVLLQDDGGTTNMRRTGSLTMSRTGTLLRGGKKASVLTPTALQQQRQ